MAFSAITPPVILSVMNAAESAKFWLGIMIWPIRVASCAREAAKTTRSIPDRRRAPMHITQGPPPEVRSVLPHKASGG
jgi:hypothetical protein